MQPVYCTGLSDAALQNLLPSVYPTRMDFWKGTDLYYTVTKIQIQEAIKLKYESLYTTGWCILI